MTVSLLPLGLVVAFGSALTWRLWLGHDGRSEAQPAAVSHSETNRDIERRLDLVVNGPIHPCAAIRRASEGLIVSDASPFTPRPRPCPSPEPWREKQ